MSEPLTITIVNPTCPHCGAVEITAYRTAKRGAVRYYGCEQCQKTFRAVVANPRHRSNIPKLGTVATSPYV